MENAKWTGAPLRELLDSAIIKQDALAVQFREYDTRIEQIAKEVYPEVSRLKQVKGLPRVLQFSARFMF